MSADELKSKGNAALQAGNVKEAIEHYTAAIAIDQTNHVLYSNRSAAYCKLKEYNSAMKDGEECVKLAPNWGKGYCRLGNALEFLGEDKKALKIYEEGLSKEPNNAALKQSIEALQEKTTPSFANPFAAPDIKEKMAAHPRLREYLNQPDFVTMLELIRKNPDQLQLVLQDRRFIDALGILLGVDVEMADDERCSPPTAAKEKKEPEKEKMEVEEISEADQLKANGNAAYKQKKFDEALECYRKAFELDSTNIIYLNNEAAVHLEMKNYEECIKVCDKAVEVGRENRADYKLIAKALSRIGGAYHKMGDLENAKKYLDKSLTEHRAPEIIKKVHEVEKLLKAKKEQEYINPELAEKEKEEGNKLFSAGKYPDAMRHYSEAIKRNPSDAKLYSNRSACYMKLMEFHSAMKDAEKCIEVDPNFIKGHLRKAACLKALKDPIKAAEAYRKALALDSNCSEAAEGLRQCMASSNDPEAVRRRAMNDPEVQKILNDPAMQIILNQMHKDPQALRDHLQNPDIAAKIQKLMEVGLISVM